jgi:serine/threonine protein kinase
VRQNATGRLFAQKQLTKAFLKIHRKRIESTKSERTILELVNRHPFIVNLYYAFQDHEKLYLILEYASGGELFRHLEVEKFFSEEVAAFYIAEIVLALDYLHNTVGVIYRDLKPENCLLDAEGHLLLTDFGLSKVAVKDANTPGGSRCNSLGVGTIEYMAPEIIRGWEDSDWGPGYGKACDWWSLGAMACDLMTGKPPFGGGNWTKIQQNIMHQKLSLPYFLSADAKDLLTRLLRKEPRKRLGVGPNDIALIKKHRFFRKIDWKKLETRQLDPPIQPLVTNPELAENFAKEFTDRAIDTVARRHSRTLSKSDPFGGFSYVASHSLLEESMLSELDEVIIDE